VPPVPRLSTFNGRDMARHHAELAHGCLSAYAYC
jgi:hypothetical protein